MTIHNMSDPEDFREMLRTMGPGMISQTFTQPVMMLWMALPPEKKDIEVLKANVREQYERVLSSFESDAELLELCASAYTGDDVGDEDAGESADPA